MKGVLVMLVMSVKLSTIKIAAVVGVLVLIAAVLVWPSGNVGASAQPNAQEVKLSDNTAKVEYLKELGYEVDPAPIEVREVLIPARFTKVYEQYNEIQKQQGFDLLSYAGKRVKQYCYQVTNYAETDESVKAQLLLYNDRIIAADLSSMSPDGFVQALTVRPDQDVITDVH